MFFNNIYIYIILYLLFSEGKEDFFSKIQFGRRGGGFGGDMTPSLTECKNWSVMQPNDSNFPMKESMFQKAIDLECGCFQK